MEWVMVEWVEHVVLPPVAPYGGVGAGVGVGIIAVAILILIALGVIF